MAGPATVDTHAVSPSTYTSELYFNSRKIFAPPPPPSKKKVTHMITLVPFGIIVDYETFIIL